MDTGLDITESETDLVRRARRGDPVAFERIYRGHSAAVFTLAVRLVGERGAAEDIVQETFLRMLGFLPGLRDGAPLRPWLKRVASNLAIDRLRRERRYDDDDQLSTLAARDADHSETTDADRLLRRLPPVARTLVWLHEVEGWTHPELAKRFRRSPSWSKSVLSRALSQLREDLASENEHLP